MEPAGGGGGDRKASTGGSWRLEMELLARKPELLITQLRLWIYSHSYIRYQRFVNHSKLKNCISIMKGYLTIEFEEVMREIWNIYGPLFWARSHLGNENGSLHWQPLGERQTALKRSSSSSSTQSPSLGKTDHATLLNHQRSFCAFRDPNKRLFIHGDATLTAQRLRLLLLQQVCGTGMGVGCCSTN